MWETATNDRETRGYLKLIDDAGLIVVMLTCQRQKYEKGVKS